MAHRSKIEIVIGAVGFVIMWWLAPPVLAGLVTIAAWTGLAGRHGAVSTEASLRSWPWW
jgi:hypothetical protein